MANLASLKIAIESGDIKKAQSELEKLSSSANKTEKSTQGVSSAFGKLGAIIGTVGFATMAIETIKVADSMKLLEARIKLVSDATESYADNQKKLISIANENKTAFSSVAQLYTKMKPDLEKMGVSTQTVMKITDSFSKSLLIGGASAQESSAAILQFSQAMASGRLQGDEYRSMIENNPRFMRLLREELGKTSAEIKQMATDGKLTADVLSGALINGFSKLKEEAKTIPTVVGGAIEVLKNTTGTTIESLDKMTGASAYVVKAIEGITGAVGKAPEYFSTFDKHIDTFILKHQNSYKVVKALSDLILDIANVGATVVEESGNLASKSLSGFATWVDSISDPIIKNLEDIKKLQQDLDKTFKKPIEKLIVPKSGEEDYKELVKSRLETAKAFSDSERELRDQQNMAFFASETERTEKETKDKEKAEKEKLKAQKKAQQDAEKLAEDWNKRKLELVYENSIAEQDEVSKPYILLEKKYNEDLEKFKGNQEAKRLLTENYYIEVERLNKETVEKFNKDEEEKLKKKEDFINRSLGLYEDEATKIIQKYTEIFDKSDLFSDEQIQKLIENMNEALEKAKPELKFSASIELDPKDLEGVPKAIASIGKGMDKLDKEQKQYKDNQKNIVKGSKEWKENDEKHVQSQINGYANIAGAMSNMFDEGSREAAAFQAIESGLAVVAGVRAILTAGTGDPYTAIPRMVAMAAMVAATLQKANIAFGGGGTKTSVSYADSVSAMAANTGTGTVLGDASKQSESITKSMEILKDFAKPQYSVLTQMNKYLASIDQKLGGVSALIYQNAGYAMGQGYTAPSATVSGIGTSFLAGNDKFNNAIEKLISAGGDKLSSISVLPMKLGSSIIGAVLNGLFGKTSVSQALTDSGIYFADTLLTSAIKEFNGSAYQTITTTTTKKSWFSKSSSSSIATYFEDLDSETERQFSLVLSNLYQTTLLAGLALDTSSEEVSKSLENFVVSIGKISLLGKTNDEIQTALEAIFGKIGDNISATAFPLLTAFQQVGEGLFTTMTRVATGMEEAGYYIGRLGNAFQDIKYTDILNKQGDVGFEALLQSIVKVDESLYGLSNGVVEIIANLDATAEELYTTYSALQLIRIGMSTMGKEAKYLTSSMVLGAGSISELGDGLSSFIENFMSDTEQIAYKTSVLSAQFASAGVTMPKTSDEFKALINSIDLSTESGQELYGRLITLSDGFNELQDAISGSDLSSLLTSITAFVTKMRTETTTASATTSFNTFMTSFNAMIDAIGSGSTELSTIGATALTNAQSYIDAVTATASSSKEIDYAKKVLANKFEGVVLSPDITLGTINDTLKFNLGDKSAIVMELNALRTQIDYLNSLNTTQTATSVKTLQAVRATIPA